MHGKREGHCRAVMLASSLLLTTQQPWRREDICGMHQGIWNTFFSQFWLPPSRINPRPLPRDDIPVIGSSGGWSCICQSLEEAEQLSEEGQQHNFFSALLLDKGPAFRAQEALRSLIGSGIWGRRLALPFSTLVKLEMAVNHILWREMNVSFF